VQDMRFQYKKHYRQSHALVIGIDRYVTAPPLSYAVSDASAIKDVLVNTLKFPEENICLLTNEAATKHAISKAFHRFSNDDIDLDDRLVVFFAGHGHTRTGSRGEVGYLVPHDADMSDFSTFVRWDDLTRNADLIRAKHVLFIMDACYGGLALTRVLGPGSTRFLKDMMLRPARQVLTAGKADEEVSDSGGPLPGHSVFTGHLIEALQGKAASTDGVLTANAVMAYAYYKVSSDKNSHQTPHYGHVDGDGDMVLLPLQLGIEEASETKDLDRLVAIPFVDEVDGVGDATAKVARVKTLLAAPSGSIELHDVLAAEVRRLLSATTFERFPLSAPYSQDEFVSRIEGYEHASMDLALMLACTAQWGTPAQLSTLQKCIARSCDGIDRTGGLTVWLGLRWYPALIELYCTGIAAVDGGRFDALAAMFETPLANDDLERAPRPFVDSAADAILQLNRSHVLQQLPGFDRRYTPLSDYLLKTLQPGLDDTLFLGKNYEVAFDEFEVYFAVAVGDSHLQRGRGFWAPIGRFGWKREEGSSLHRIRSDAASHQDRWAPLQAGLFGGSYARFKTSADQLAETVGRLNWF
jgi:hypothetical protein